MKKAPRLKDPFDFLWRLEERHNQTMWVLYEPTRITDTGEIKGSMVMVDYVKPDLDLLCFMEDETGKIVGVTVEDGGRW